MLTVEQIPHERGMLVKLQYPDSTKPKYENILTQAAFDRFIQINYRNYIIAKLKCWLNQRQFAIDIYPQSRVYPAKCRMIAGLKDVLEYYTYASLVNVIAMVYREAESFEFIAPHIETSRSKHYYDAIIVPIITYCKTNHIPR